MFPLNSVFLGDAGANNLAYAMSLYEKGEPLFYRRGPLFYGMIALSFKLFGPSVEHAVWVTRLFVPINLGLVFIITRSMFGSRAALLASILVFFSHAINLEAAKLEVDNVMPAFMLAGLWLFWMSAKKRNTALAVASGFFLGLGWLVKEAAALYLPLFFIPFLFGEFRNRQQAIRSLVALGSFFITLAPWILYIASKGGTIMDVLGAASPRSTVEHLKLPISFSAYVLDHFIFNAPANLLSYFKNYFVPNFPLWLPMLTAFGYAVRQAFGKKSLELSFLIGGVLFFSPIAIYQGGIGERLGQCYVIFLILYILLGLFLSDMADLVRGRLSKAWSGKGGLALGGLFLLFLALEFSNPLNPVRSTLYVWAFSKERLQIANALIQHLPKESILDAVSRIGVPEALAAKLSDRLEDYKKGGFQVGERFDEGVQEAAAWIRQNVQEGETILSSSFLTESLPFYTRFQFQFVPFEKDNMIPYRPANDGPEKLAPFKQERLLGFISYHGFKNENISRYQCIYLAFEKPFIESLNSEPAEYLVLYKAGPSKERYTDFFLEYFSSRSNLKLLFDNSRTRIYKINGTFFSLGQNDDFFYVNDELQSDVVWLKDQFPDSYRKLVEDLSTFCSAEGPKRCPTNMFL